MNLLSCLKGFIATIESKSFSKAAQRLYISPSKLSKQITWLEQELKVVLFIRSSKRLIITEPGQILYEKSLELFEQLERVKLIANPETIEFKGVIKLYLIVPPATPYLTSLCIEFMQKYPQIEMDIVVGADTKDIFSATFDLAISFDEIKHPKLVCNKLFSVHRNVFVSPAYIAQYGQPQTIDELRNHQCLINTLYGLQNKWVFNQRIIHVSGPFKSNSAYALKQAAVAGIGILWAPYFSVHEEIKKGELVQILPQDGSPEISLYSIYPIHLVNERKVNLLLNFLCEKETLEEMSLSLNTIQ
ncbi:MULTISPECIES: LysR family transcriptional regulator [Legionella]|uniref:LysR family transcriptional regulator n=1 Tax=Legionella resiliens TaxID=2905958 RepID=A0ABS8X467_9GAMM|nr:MULTISPECIES: LysR family transcriptional regulator [unclassified Legionella]MCE0723609.1 LysR family transcriptional regulator [Legionella sp. 9fVS26]MCE3532762.1 LysR family transcriptional regulator [Legionella sp. 8cVS16]QLZ68897.1 LysR family transcriptional regulator [Legionella sp. PC1000]